MTVAIICDGNKKVGAGHLFRCRAIAEELRKHSIDVTFFIPSPDLEPYVNEYEFLLLSGLFEDTEIVVGNLMEELKTTNCAFVLVDSHSASEKLLAGLKSSYTTLYIDDLLKYPYPVDIIINAHADVKEENYLRLYKQSKTSIPTLLVGAKYFPMITHKAREEYAGRNEMHVGFFAGGADPDHVTVRMLRYFEKKDIHIDYIFEIVVGRMNTDYQEIRRICDENKHFRLSYGLSDLTEVYQRIDVAVSAAGITLYELAYYGVPTIVYSMVDNQVHTADAFDRLGASINIGDTREQFDFGVMFSEIDVLIKNTVKMCEMHNRLTKINDGKGAERIAKYILDRIRSKEV